MNVKPYWNFLKLAHEIANSQDFFWVYKLLSLGFYAVFLKQRSRSLLFIKKIAGFSPFPIPRANYLWELADESPD